MTLRSQQDLLARLYTDPELRARFLEDPQRVGASSGLTNAESNELAAVSAEELNYFSNSLFRKRLHEVERILPQSREVLGDEFTNHFREFSRGFVPNSVKKHLDDAFEFTGFLLANLTDDSIRNAVRRERVNLAFYGYRRAFVFKPTGGRPWLFLRIGRREITF